MEQYSISRKKIDKLYGDVAEEVMKVRVDISIAWKKKPLTLEELDSILYTLHIKAPQAAIEVFKKQEKQ